MRSLILATAILAPAAALAQDAEPAPVPAPAPAEPSPLAPPPAPPVDEGITGKVEPRFELHGYARMPLAFDATPRAPHLVDSDYFLSGFAYTRLNEPDWAELFLSASHLDYRVKFGIFTSLFSDYSTTELESQAGIAQASVEARRFLGVPTLSVELGVFWDRFGHIEPYDTYVFARTHQGGFKARWQPTETAWVQVGAGAHEAVRQQNQGMTPLVHVTGGVPAGPVQLGAYVMHTWTRDKPKLSPIKDGDLTILGVDARVPVATLGPLYGALAYYRASQALYLAPSVELLHSAGGRGLTENFLGLSSSMDGTGSLWTFALDFPMKLPAHTELRVFGMVTHVSSQQQSELPSMNKDGRTYLKWGAEPGWRVRPGLVASLRYDRVVMDMDDEENSFRAISPRLRFPLSGWGELMLQYSHYFYGDKITLRPGQVPLESLPDAHAFKIQAQAAW